eukprot:TRINITY_DN3252_c0_g1_i2.p1 TRINITY_DN3252_c0_g1~~TRINITY_DN3252_c0_g1_i2.p1  ORF type:complete len:650 (+),score=124.53 TRINITY_DN3252_c0_g1_i2:210-1952(+)
MTRFDGIPFECAVPLMPSNGSETFTDLPATSNITQLLSPLARQCFAKRSNQWWQYELCHMRQIRQFHDEAGRVIAEHSLGSFQHGGIIESDEEGYSHYYGGGAECGTPPSARSTSVKFICSPSGNVLLDITEKPECTYTLTFGTPLVCGHQAFNTMKTGTAVDTMSLLAPLQASKECLKLIAGTWFTYELCIGAVLRQYHQNADGSVAEEYILGKAPLDTAALNPVVVAATEEEPAYLQISYSEAGTMCDLALRGRTTNIHFMCATEGSRLLRVYEEATCEYVALVSTPLVCSLPALRPVPVVKTPIICRPLEPQDRLERARYTPTTPVPTLISEVTRQQLLEKMKKADGSANTAAAAALGGDGNNVHVVHLEPGEDPMQAAEALARAVLHQFQQGQLDVNDMEKVHVIELEAGDDPMELARALMEQMSLSEDVDTELELSDGIHMTAEEKEFVEKLSAKYHDGKLKYEQKAGVAAPIADPSQAQKPQQLAPQPLATSPPEVADNVQAAKEAEATAQQQSEQPSEGQRIAEFTKRERAKMQAAADNGYRQTEAKRADRAERKRSTAAVRQQKKDDTTEQQ